MSQPNGTYRGEYSRKWFRSTGEFRKPRKGEYYLSGAIITAWRATNDLDSPYWIAREVENNPLVESIAQELHITQPIVNPNGVWRATVENVADALGEHVSSFDRASFLRTAGIQ
jgi:hypothetical protein